MQMIFQNLKGRCTFVHSQDLPRHDFTPSPEYPILQPHLNDPTVSLQVAKPWQLWVLSAHSSISGCDHQTKSEARMKRCHRWPWPLDYLFLVSVFWLLLFPCTMITLVIIVTLTRKKKELKYSNAIIVTCELNHTLYLIVQLIGLHTIKEGKYLFQCFFLPFYLVQDVYMQMYTNCFLWVLVMCSQVSGKSGMHRSRITYERTAGLHFWHCTAPVKSIIEQCVHEVAYINVIQHVAFVYIPITWLTLANSTCFLVAFMAWTFVSSYGIRATWVGGTRKFPHRTFIFICSNTQQSEGNFTAL